jgi:hypothetical protein
MRPYFCSFMARNAGCVTKNAPFRWTSSTASRSAVARFANDLSRRIPALLMTMSTRPNASSADFTIASPPSGVVTES